MKHILTLKDHEAFNNLAKETSIDIVFGAAEEVDKVALFDLMMENEYRLSQDDNFDDGKVKKLYEDTIFKHLSYAEISHLLLMVDTQVKQFHTNVNHETCGDKVIEILQHQIRYRYDGCDDMKMTASDIDHVEQMIEQGCCQGELCTVDDNDNTIYGWWQM